MRTKEQEALAYKVRKWAEGQFGQAKDDHLLDGEILRLGGGLLKEYGKAKNKEVAGKHADKDAEQTALELFNRFFNFSSKKVEKPVGWANQLHETLDGLSEFKELVHETSGDVDLSGIATKELLPFMTKALEDVFDAAEEKHREEQERKENGEPGDGQQQGGGTSVAEDNARRQLRKALGLATEEVRDTKEAVDGMKENGLMPGSGSTDPIQRAVANAKAVSMIRSNKKLKRLLKLIGRLTRLAAQKKAQRSAHGRSEVVGIHKGRDIERLTTSSLAMLAVPALRMKFIEEYVNGSLLQYELRGKEKVGRGEIVVLVDQSGSMSYNDTIGTATAVAAATALAAKKEGRDTTIRFFQRSLCGNIYEVKNGQHIPHHTPMEWVQNLISEGTGGGTRLSHSLAQLINEGVSEKADILIVTDGHVERINPHVAEQVAKLKEEKGLQVYGMTINGGALHRTMKEICEQVYNLDTNLLGSADCIALM